MARPLNAEASQNRNSYLESLRSSCEHITKLRPQIGVEMDPEFLTCSFGNFQGHLPFCPDNRAMETCLEKLTKKSGQGKAILVNLRNGRYRLNDFLESGKGVSELVRHGFVEKMSAQLQRCKLDDRTPTYRYFDCLNATIHSDIEGFTNKIDGAMISKNSAEHSTTNIAVACEWKTESSESVKLDNNSKVVSANLQIMNDDVRRMFCYGLTIEGRVVRVWYFSRSFSLVSEEIDFVEHPEILVKIFVSFMFATEKEMGYDPYVTRYSHIQYVYEIGNRFFRTEDVISGYRSNNISGRMARIWSAREVDSNKEDAKPIGTAQCVLKDVWLEAGAKTEMDIQRDLFYDIEQFWKTNPPAGLENLWNVHKGLVTSGGYRDYFLCHEVDYSGETTKPYNKEFFLLKPGMFLAPKKSNPPGSPTPSESRCHTNSQRLTVAHTMEENFESRKPAYDREFASRRQYRVVFKERCQATVGQLPTLGKVIDILGQTLIPLQLMFCAGWVHRDISSGNILAYQEPGGALRTKLSDLEYARKFPRDDGKVAGDPKTGTPYFMALEILQLSYLAFPPSSEPEPTKDSSSEVTLTNTYIRRPDRIEIEPPPRVVHNFQHDLEPLWWILLWTITCRVKHPQSQAYAKTIFDNTMRGSPERHALFTESRLDVKLRSVLKNSILGLADEMEDMRHYLMLHYGHRYGIEKLNNPCQYTGIHGVFDGFFLSLADRKDSTWPSEEPLLGYTGSMEAPGAPATDDATPTAGTSDSAQPEKQPDQPRIAAPKRVIRLISSRESIRTRSRSKLTESPGLAEVASGSMSSKRQKTQK